MSAPTFNDGPFAYVMQQPIQKSEELNESDNSNVANAVMEDENSRTLEQQFTDSFTTSQVSPLSEFAAPLPRVPKFVDDRAGYEYSDDEEDEDEHADAIEDRLIDEIMFQSIPDWMLELESEKFKPIRRNLEDHLTGKTIPELREILRELTKS